VLPLEDGNVLKSLTKALMILIGMLTMGQLMHIVKCFLGQRKGLIRMKLFKILRIRIIKFKREFGIILLQLVFVIFLWLRFHESRKNNNKIYSYKFLNVAGILDLQMLEIVWQVLRIFYSIWELIISKMVFKNKKTCPNHNLLSQNQSILVTTMMTFQNVLLKKLMNSQMSTYQS